jgi:hypothetical protein
MHRFSRLGVFVVMAAVGAPALAGAKGKQKAAATATAGLVKMPIRNSGSPIPSLLIDAPAGAKYEEKFTNTLVTSGDHFGILISHGKFDVKQAKEDLASPDATTSVKRYLVETPDTLVYEGERGMEAGVFFDVSVKVGEVYFTCSDFGGMKFTKEDAEVMVKACKTLRKP